MDNSIILGNDNVITNPEPNSIVFSLNNEEKLKITKEGFYVNGKLVEDNKEIYNQFMTWLNGVKFN